MSIDKEIFRAYDIRGIVGHQLNEETIHQLGRAFATEVLEQGEDALITARDGRLSSPKLMGALQEGVLSTGCRVIDIGIVPTPLLYFATHTLGCNSGVMLTGSHNPPDYNGLKPVIKRKNLSSEAINSLYERIQNNALRNGSATSSAIDIRPHYLQYVTEHIKISRALKVVIDCGNGVAGEIAPELFKHLGCEVIALYTEIDGHFPHHHPDPSIPANMQDLIKRVQKEKADIGFAFDGDGDRLGVVCNEGEIIWPDRQLALFAKDVLSRHPGTPVVYDVKCSRQVTATIKQYGGIPVMYRTGHSLIKNKMIEMQSLVSGELSGHIYFNENWFGFDDGMYTAARLLEILSQQSITSSQLFSVIPVGKHTPELKLSMPEHQKFLFIEKLVKQAQFPDAEITTIDGLRADFSNGWGLVRASNTTPHLILRFEADDEASLQRIQARFRALLLSLDSTLTLPF